MTDHGPINLEWTGTAWLLRMHGFTESGPLGTYIWPHGVPHGVQISVLQALTWPTVIGDFELTGVTAENGHSMDPWWANYFREHGLVSETDEIYHAVKDEHGNVVKKYDYHEGSDVAVTPGAKVDWNAVVSAMVEKAERRVGEQIPYVHSAVNQFHAWSQDQIREWVHHNEPVDSISWGSLVEGLLSGIQVVFPIEAEATKFVLDTMVKVFSSGLENRLAQAAGQVQEAREKLEHGVGALVTEVEQRTIEAVDKVRPQIKTAIHDYMRDEKHPVMDPDWIDEMVWYFGFPERTKETVTQPILQWLEHSFTDILAEVNAEIAKSRGDYPFAG